MTDSLFVLIATAVACSIVGVFVMLRNLAMICDAISHSILLGIVLAYFITKDLHSPFLIVGASIFGVITCACIELLTKTRFITQDTSVGIVFPMFFSVAVILISVYAKNVHIDTDVVLMGEVIMAPFNRLEIFGLDLPRSLWIMFFVIIANIVFISIFYRVLNISSFDMTFASMVGISISILYYCLMAMVSLTAVASFESVGAILTISFFVAPAASAYLLSKNMKKTIVLSLIYAVANTCIGFYFAWIWNLSISGMCATVFGISFLLTLMFCPDGIVVSKIRHYKKRGKFTKEMIVLHMDNHSKDDNMYAELGISSMKHHFNWSGLRLSKYMNSLQKEGYVNRDDKMGVYTLTQKGRKYQKEIRSNYGLIETR